MSRTGTTTVPARLASTPDDYPRIGVDPRTVKPWEDGMGSDGSPGADDAPGGRPTGIRPV